MLKKFFEKNVQRRAGGPERIAHIHRQLRCLCMLYYM